MENTSKVKNWKQCPNCKGYIPQSWQQHKKCGWNVKEQPQKGFKIESMPTTPEPEHTLTEDEFILDNIYKSWDIATKFYDKTKADNKAMTTLLVEVMRERHASISPQG